MKEPDSQLLQDAYEAALKMIAIVGSVAQPDRATIDNAVRWASLAFAKLIAYQLQQKNFTPVQTARPDGAGPHAS